MILPSTQQSIAQADEHTKPKQALKKLNYGL
jgi:hypothetical protein